MCFVDHDNTKNRSHCSITLRCLSITTDLYFSNNGSSIICLRSTPSVKYLILVTVFTFQSIHAVQDRWIRMRHLCGHLFKTNGVTHFGAESKEETARSQCRSSMSISGALCSSLFCHAGRHCHCSDTSRLCAGNASRVFCPSCFQQKLRYLCRLAATRFANDDRYSMCLDEIQNLPPTLRYWQPSSLLLDMQSGVSVKAGVDRTNATVCIECQTKGRTRGGSDSLKGHSARRIRQSRTIVFGFARSISAEVV